MPPALKYVLDAVAGVTLLFALLLVFVVDHLLKERPAEPGKNTLKVNVASKAPKSAAKRLKLAVTVGGPKENLLKPREQQNIWDDMGKLLNQLGKGYEFTEINAFDIVKDPRILNDYDVLFLTCSETREPGLPDALRDFVGKGKTLYASDWRYDDVAQAFPDVVDRNTQGEGNETRPGEHLTANIVDPALQEVMGKKTIDLKFDLPRWKTAAFAGPRVTPLIRATYPIFTPGKELPKIGFEPTREAPLMVKFTFGDSKNPGTVFFTSFHNEKNNGEDEKKLLNFLVFRLVTANLDAEVAGKLVNLGFEPQRSNLFSTAGNVRKVTGTHKLEREGTLSFTLGFPYEGPKLRFNIKSPDDLEYTAEVESTHSVEIPNARAGVWTYTVTALEGTPDNFPFTVTPASKK